MDVQAVDNNELLMIMINITDEQQCLQLLSYSHLDNDSKYDLMQLYRNIDISSDNQLLHEWLLRKEILLKS